MTFGNDKDNLMRVSISERFADLDEYIAAHYVEVAAMATAMSVMAEETVADMEPTSAPARERESCRKGFFGAKFTGAAPMANFMQSQPVCDSAPIKPQKTLDDVVNNLDKSFMELVFTFADERGINDVELQKKACINRKAFSKLKCGTTKRPSKPTALCFALALELSLDETRDLLSRAGLALSPCSKTDVIVQYFIEKEAYDIATVNEALFAHGEECIGDVEE